VTDTASVIEMDPVLERIIAKSPGFARVDAHWTGGDVTGSLEITVVDPLATPEKENEGGIKIFPNPNKGILYVENDFSSSVELQILDMSGRLMVAREYRGNIQIDTQKLPAGTYMLIHKLGDKFLRHKLIML